MTEFRPPAPVPPKERPSLWRMFWMARRCTLSILFERGYSMKMGHIRFPGWNHFMVNEPKWVRHVLVDHADRFPKGEMLCAMMKPLVGDGIFISSGDLWKRQRRMIDPAFEQTRLQTAFPLMMDAVEAMERRFDALADGAALRADVETTHVTADVIFRTIFLRADRGRCGGPGVRRLRAVPGDRPQHRHVAGRRHPAVVFPAAPESRPGRSRDQRACSQG